MVRLPVLRSLASLALALGALQPAQAALYPFYLTGLPAAAMT